MTVRIPRLSRGIRIGMAALLAGALIAGGVSTAASAVPVVAAGSAAEPKATPGTIADRIEAAAEAGATGEALVADTPLPSSGPGSPVLADDGRLAVTVTFASMPTTAQRAAVAGLARIDRVFSFVPGLSASVDPKLLSELAAVDGVVSVAPDLQPRVAGVGAAPRAAAAGAAACRSIPVEADGPLRSAAARERFGVDGTGVKVGIISDSFARAAAPASTWAQDVAAGVLPGAGNPCGHQTDVEVLHDAAGGADEGRAMAQLVHGIAPGAELLFHDGGRGSLAMADAVLALARAGADIIVDDLSQFDEPYFQQGTLSWAITTAQRDYGVTYLTSAGNETAVAAAGEPGAGMPISAWQTREYHATECPEWITLPAGVTTADCLDFSPTWAGDPTDTFTFQPVPDHDTVFLMSWGEPMYGVDSELTLQIYDSSPETPTLVQSSERLDGITPNEIVDLESTRPPGDYHFVVVRALDDEDAGEAPSPAVWIGTPAAPAGVTFREHYQSDRDVIVGPITYGHQSDGSAISVAAANWQTPTTPERYTSIGPGRLLFEPSDPLAQQPAAALPAELVVSSPQFASVDGTRTSFFSPPGRDGIFRFSGTSAAAPNAAAVFALAHEYAPDAGAESLLHAAVSTTASMVNRFDPAIVPDEHVFGAGLIDAVGMLDALPARAVTKLALVADAPDRMTATWASSGADGYEATLLDGTTEVASAKVAGDTTTASFDRLRPTIAYTVRVTSLDAAGERGGVAEAGPVATPRPAPPAKAPAAPSSDRLTAANAGGLTVADATVKPGGTVTVSGLPELQWVYGYAYSSPAALGWQWTPAASASGGSTSATFAIPADLAPGAHRIAVLASDGTLLGWAGFTVAGALPATGLDGGGLVPLGVGATALLALGLTLVATRRRLARR